MIGSTARAARCRSPSSTSPTPCVDCGEEGCCRSPSTRIPEEPPLLRLLHEQRPATRRSSSSAALQAALRGESRPGRGAAVLYIPHPVNGNHNGGQIQFGPDGFLFIAPATAGPGRPAEQRTGTRRACSASSSGSILCHRARQEEGRKQGEGAGRKRLRRRPYGIPRDNPFVGGAGLDEVYALGLRNPFRFSFDSPPGRSRSATSGRGCREEINYLSRGSLRGANFGWSRFEGTSVFNSSRVPPVATFPIHEYDNLGAGPCARRSVASRALR